MADDAKQPATKGDLHQLRAELRQEMQKIKEEILLHFDFVAEHITANFQGAFAEKLEDHEQRITRMEDRAGVAA